MKPQTRVIYIVELEALKTKVDTLLELENSKQHRLLKNALHELYNQDKIKLISHNELHYITLAQYYFSEKGVAQKLKMLLECKSPNLFDLDMCIKQLQ